jgi:hypothetical protein
MFWLVVPAPAHTPRTHAFNPGSLLVLVCFLYSSVRSQTVRSQLAGPYSRRAHRQRAVCGGVVPHDTRVLQVWACVEVVVVVVVVVCVWACGCGSS